MSTYYNDIICIEKCVKTQKIEADYLNHVVTLRHQTELKQLVKMVEQSIQYKMHIFNYKIILTDYINDFYTNSNLFDDLF